MRNGRRFALILLPAVALLLGLGLSPVLRTIGAPPAATGSSSTGTAAQVELRSLEKSLEPLIESFNREGDGFKFLALLSPT